MWYCGVKLNCKAKSISELSTSKQNPPSKSTKINLFLRNRGR